MVSGLLIAAFGVGSLVFAFANYSMQRRRTAAPINNN